MTDAKPKAHDDYYDDDPPKCWLCKREGVLQKDITQVGDGDGPRIEWFCWECAKRFNDD